MGRKTSKSADEGKDPKDEAQEDANQDVNQDEQGLDDEMDARREGQGPVLKEQPPRMTESEIAEAQRREAQEKGSKSAEGPQMERGMTSGETDPASIPELTRLQARQVAEGKEPVSPPDRPLSEGEVARNVGVLRTKGDTAYMHPQYVAEARTEGMPPRGDSGEKSYRVVGTYQLGAIAGPGRGGPDRSYTLTELGITESQVPRLLSKGVLVED